MDTFGKKVLLWIWWEHIGVMYYELLQPRETIAISNPRNYGVDINVKPRYLWIQNLAVDLAGIYRCNGLRTAVTALNRQRCTKNEHFIAIIKQYDPQHKAKMENLREIIFVVDFVESHRSSTLWTFVVMPNHQW